MAAMSIFKLLRLASLLAELLVYALATGIVVILCLRALRLSCHQKSFNWKMFLRAWLCLAGLNARLMNVGKLPGPLIGLFPICFLLDLPGMIPPWHRHPSASPPQA